MIGLNGWVTRPSSVASGVGLSRISRFVVVVGIGAGQARHARDAQLAEGHRVEVSFRGKVAVTARVSTASNIAAKGD